MKSPQNSNTCQCDRSANPSPMGDSKIIDMLSIHSSVILEIG
jgi:hypothetical protein